MTALGVVLYFRAAAQNEHEHSETAHHEADEDSHNERDHSRITAHRATLSGIKTEKVGPRPIKETVSLFGRVALDPEHTAELGARFPALVRELHKVVGDNVKAGDVLAILENNDSLELYPIKAPISGTIISRHCSLGDLTGAEPLFTVSDLSFLVAELSLFPKDLDRVKLGQKLKVKSLASNSEATGFIYAISPIADEVSQSVLVRARLSETKNPWPVGLALSAELVLSERLVPLAVKSSAIQRLRDSNVVFAQINDDYEARTVSIGARDGDYVEVLDGILPGISYVSENSFLIKADIEKSSAAHDH